MFTKGVTSKSPVGADLSAVQGVDCEINEPAALFHLPVAWYHDYQGGYLAACFYDRELFVCLFV